MLEELVSDAKRRMDKSVECDAARVPDRAHGARVGGAARPHPGRLLRHEDAAQPARADQRAGAAPAGRDAVRQERDARTSSGRSWSPTSASTPPTTARSSACRSRR